MFADDLVLCAWETYVLEVELGQWRNTLGKGSPVTGHQAQSYAKRCQCRSEQVGTGWMEQLDEDVKIYATRGCH